MIWRCRECGCVASIHIGSLDHDEAILIGSEREDYCAVCDSYTRQVLKRQRRESTLSKGCERGECLKSRRSGGDPKRVEVTQYNSLLP